MWLLTHSRLFDIYFYHKVLFFVWIFTQCNPARGDPDTATVTKARCYANCLTENPATNETGIPCQTSACKECLGPCGWSYPDEARCKETCKTSSCCQDSCEFLTKVKTLSSIITGDGSLPPNPRNLTVTNRSFTSISLQWEAVKNTNGSPVYLIEMELSRGKAKYFPLYMEEVFVVPQATISLPNLCSNIAEGRFLFNLLRPLSLKFKVAVLTENSSLSTGEQTVQTTFVKPEPVKNVTVERIEYEPSSFFTFGQLKATISLITPKVLDYKHPITSHYLEWRNDPMACYSGGFMDAILRPNQTTCSLYMRLYNIRCSQFFVKIHVSSVIGCSISDPVTLTYTFPGCQNITNFPKRECVRLTGKILLVPIKDGVVRNIRASIPLTSKDDYPFYNVTINWDPPAYHFSPVVLYRVTLLTYKRCSGKPFLHYAGFHVEATPYTTFFHLLPNTTYHTVVRAMFIRWQSFLNGRSIIFTTPDINRTELYVRFKGNQLNPSPKGNSFDVNISWDEPIFNRRLTGYQFSYQVGNRKMVVNETKKTHFIIPEVMHGEQFTYRVTPKYNYTWLEGEEQLGKATVEVPPDDDVEVRNIEVGEFALEKGNSTFSVKFSWTGPVFNFTLYGYHFNYELTGYKEHAIMFKGNVKKPELNLSAIRPKETVRLKVTPMYENRNIQKIESEVMETAPAPRAELLTVLGLKNEELVPSSSTSFSTVVKWEKPLFTQSNVSYYVYRTTEEIKGQMKRRAISLNNQNKTTETSVIIDGIYLNEKVEFQVTPVFDTSVVTGVAAKISIVRTEPKADEALSTGFYTSGLIAGLVIGFLLVTFICMIFIWRRWRKQKMLKKKSLIPGKNRLIIDNWELDGDLVTLEDEIGEGAFGKVYKGTLVKPTSSLHQRFCLRPWKKTSKTISGSETYVVAVKMLHNMPDESVRQEFLDEIQLMKAVGSHKNIVSMVGCCTVEEPMFLLVEYAPYGDLLHYLRNHRKKACKDKRIYVNIPMSNEELGRSNTFTTPEDQIKTGGETKTLNTEEEEKEDCIEEILTPGNLMAFAWHVCQGMEYLARKGYVHRDLAARNVLIGEKKIAKVSDFGLSRYVYEEKVYHGKRNRKLPLKWMSTEAIFDQTFTMKSDV